MRRPVKILLFRLLLSWLAIVPLSCSTPAGELPEVEVQADGDPGLSLTSLLSGTAEGFARATAPRRFAFPEDHGSHPDFRTEWWYLTGNVTAPSGRRFGYQFTLFRNALTAEEPTSESEWATRQIFMAHFAVTDVDAESFHFFERFARGAMGLAGVELGPFRAWLEDWQITSRSSSPPFRLQARADDIALDLDLDPVKPLVLQGEAGLSRKGREPGNASYYYAFTRLATAGRIRLGEVELEVSGSSWLDREWSTSALEAGQSGWDWFALQLDDGTDLMVYQMRRDDGTADPVSSGSLVGSDGAKVDLDWDEFRLEVLDRWSSPSSGTTYPAGWRLVLPREKLTLLIDPLVPDQELRLAVTYWEGAVTVEGDRDGVPITGRGYVELTGYSAP